MQVGFAAPPAPGLTAGSQGTAPSGQPGPAINQPVPTADLSVPRGPTAVAPPAQTASSQAPVEQVSAALLTIARAPDGGQRMTLRLEPAELGQIQIRIDRPQDGSANIDITVQRPETMNLLLRDQPELQRALDQAGVPADGRSLTLHVATPDPLSSSAGAHGGMAANAGPGQGGNGNGSGTRSGGTGTSDERSDSAPDETPAPPPRWLRAGLDITA